MRIRLIGSRFIFGGLVYGGTKYVGGFIAVDENTATQNICHRQECWCSLMVVLYWDSLVSWSGRCNPPVALWWETVP